MAVETTKSSQPWCHIHRNRFGNLENDERIRLLITGANQVVCEYCNHIYTALNLLMFVILGNHLHGFCFNQTAQDGCLDPRSSFQALAPFGLPQMH